MDLRRRSPRSREKGSFRNPPPPPEDFESEGDSDRRETLVEEGGCCSCCWLLLDVCWDLSVAVEAAELCVRSWGRACRLSLPSDCDELELPIVRVLEAESPSSCDLCSLCLSQSLLEFPDSFLSVSSQSIHRDTGQHYAQRAVAAATCVVPPPPFLPSCECATV